MQTRFLFVACIRAASMMFCWLLVGCSPEVELFGPVEPTVPTACAAGKFTLPNGEPQPAGLPPDRKCEPGELTLDDGTCQAAGVSPQACGKGFMPDGKQGCVAILPANECPFGQMAVPGETACHEIAPCGNGTWGDIPSEANTQYVDQAYPGNDSNGTQAKPWTTINQGVAAAAKGAIVAIAAGSYKEDVIVHGKPVRLWGGCPAMVEIAGKGLNYASLEVTDHVGGTKVQGIALTGSQQGLRVSGGSGIVVEHAWVHDAGMYGVEIDNVYGSTSVTVRSSLIEQNYVEGVTVISADVIIENSVVRAQEPDPQVGWGGEGIGVGTTYKGARANLTVRGSLVEKNHYMGIGVLNANATIEDTVVRTTEPDFSGNRGGGIVALSNDYGRGNVTVRGCNIEQNVQHAILVWAADGTIENTTVRATGPDPDGAGIMALGYEDIRTKLSLHGCLVEGNQNAGITIDDADTTIEATLVRDTLPPPTGSILGRGINIDGLEGPSNVAIRGCLVENNNEVGVLARGSTATIDATLVRGTKSDAVGSGVGIVVQVQPGTLSPSNVSVQGCLIEQNHHLGVMVSGSDVTIQDTVVRATESDSNGDYGGGVAIDEVSTLRSKATICRSLIEQNRAVGVLVVDSYATIADSVIRETMPTTSMSFGDGITAVDTSDVEILNTDVSHNARAGVASFGSQVKVSGGAFACNAFDFEGEPYQGAPFSFAGSTGWLCGHTTAANCTELGDNCTVTSSGIEPPPPLP